MMDILKVVIKEGQMPEDCGMCDETYISNGEPYNHCCFYDNDVRQYNNSRHPDCPLIEKETD